MRHVLAENDRSAAIEGHVPHHGRRGADPLGVRRGRQDPHAFLEDPLRHRHAVDFAVSGAVPFHRLDDLAVQVLHDSRVLRQQEQCPSERVGSRQVGSPVKQGHVPDQLVVRNPVPLLVGPN